MSSGFAEAILQRSQPSCENSLMVQAKNLLLMDEPNSCEAIKRLCLNAVFSWFKFVESLISYKSITGFQCNLIQLSCNYLPLRNPLKVEQTPTDLFFSCGFLMNFSFLCWSVFYHFWICLRITGKLIRIRGPADKERKAELLLSLFQPFLPYRPLAYINFD